MSRRRPSILFIVDAPGWAHDFKARNLCRALGDAYDVTERYQHEVAAEDLDNADLVVVFYWLQVQSMHSVDTAIARNRHKILMGICSHRELEGHFREQGLATLRSLAQGVFVVNKLLFHEYQSLFEVPVFYTPNGVDTHFFSPREGRHTGRSLRVGWAGSLANHGPRHRGYYDLIVPACNYLEGINLVTAAREERWRTPEEMREFYQSLDIYICASRSEGTPNPCLEAAASRIPLLTTKVGQMPELVQHGVNGLFVEREIEDIERKLCLLRESTQLRLGLGSAVRESILEWDWTIVAQNYRTMFDAILSQR